MAASANVFEEEMEEEEEEVQAMLPALVISMSDQYIDIHPLIQMDLGEKEESSESKSFKSDTDQKRDTPRSWTHMHPT